MSACRTVSEIFSVKKRRELETGGKGRSRSLKMPPFDRSYDFLLVSHCKDVSIGVCWGVRDTGALTLSLGRVYSESILAAMRFRIVKGKKVCVTIY